MHSIHGVIFGSSESFTVSDLLTAFAAGRGYETSWIPDLAKHWVL